MIWSPDLFLNEYGSTLLAKIRGINEKISVVNVQRIQQQWLQMKCQRLSKDILIHINQVGLLKFHVQPHKKNNFSIMNYETFP